MKVLVTSFTPFNKEKVNYSAEVLKYIENVDKVVLDVVYDECYETLKNKFDINNYDYIISLGEARMRAELTLETQAINISSCSLPDNKGTIKKDEKINKDNSEVIKTKVDIGCIKDLVNYSNNAGKFVCNNLYYHLLCDYPEKSLFIHIPNCYDKIEEYKKYSNIINQIIKTLCDKQTS